MPPDLSPTRWQQRRLVGAAQQLVVLAATVVCVLAGGDGQPAGALAAAVARQQLGVMVVRAAALRVRPAVVVAGEAEAAGGAEEPRDRHGRHDRHDRHASLASDGARAVPCDRVTIDRANLQSWGDSTG